MKKKLLLGLALAMSLTMAAGFAACGDKGGKDAPSSGSQAEDTITVTYYHNTTELRSVEIQSGSKAEEYTPTLDGYEFLGWYSEISCAAGNEFDFDQALTEDTDIFASFRENTYVEDTTLYYAVGTGAGDMKASAWNQLGGVEALNFVKDTTVTDKNVFTLELTLYAGDQFQICHGGSWDGQMGIGFFKGATLNEDVDPSENTYVTAKDDSGDVVFCASKGFGDSPNGWNAILAEGKDGIYRITLTTYVNASYNMVEWELVEAIAPLTATHEMYLVGTFDVEGDIDVWYDNSEDEALKMKESEDKSYWTATVVITEANYASWAEGKAQFKVKNNISGSDYGINGTSDNVSVTAGTYMIKYTVETNNVEIQEAKYYVIGTFLDGDDNAVNFSVKNEVTPQLTVDGDTATVTFTAVDVTGNESYSWIAEQDKPGVCAIKVVYGTEFGVINWYSDTANNGDNFYLTAGEHTVTLTISTCEVVVA